MHGASTSAAGRFEDSYSARECGIQSDVADGAAGRWKSTTGILWARVDAHDGACCARYALHTYSLSAVICPVVPRGPSFGAVQIMMVAGHRIVSQPALKSRKDFTFHLLLPSPPLPSPPFSPCYGGQCQRQAPSSFSAYCRVLFFSLALVRLDPACHHVLINPLNLACVGEERAREGQGGADQHRESQNHTGSTSTHRLPVVCCRKLGSVVDCRCKTLDAVEMCHATAHCLVNPACSEESIEARHRHHTKSQGKTVLFQIDAYTPAPFS